MIARLSFALKNTGKALALVGGAVFVWYAVLEITSRLFGFAGPFVMTGLAMTTIVFLYYFKTYTPPSEPRERQESIQRKVGSNPNPPGRNK